MTRERKEGRKRAKGKERRKMKPRNEKRLGVGLKGKKRELS